MNRPTDLSQTEIVLKQAAALGFPVNTYIILGIPGHSLEDMVSSILYLAGKKTLLSVQAYFILVPEQKFTGRWRIAVMVLNADFSLLRSSLFPVETDGFKRLDL